ncbi:MAG: hypothetical protein KAJ18_09460 [Candidatus Omnitrophica bacterium]|nr:hypothetical protein [Candidatus Omnitrophota bacterium]
MLFCRVWVFMCFLWLGGSAVVQADTLYHQQMQQYTGLYQDYFERQQQAKELKVEIAGQKRKYQSLESRAKRDKAAIKKLQAREGIFVDVVASCKQEIKKSEQKAVALQEKYWDGQTWYGHHQAQYQRLAHGQEQLRQKIKDAYASEEALKEKISEKIANFKALSNEARLLKKKIFENQREYDQAKDGAAEWWAQTK